MSEMKLPRSIQAQVEAVEAIEAAMHAPAQQAPQQTQPAPQVPVAVAEPMVQPVAPSAPVVDDAAARVAAAEQKARTIEGMLRADMKTLRDANRDTEGKLTQALDALSAIKAKLDSPDRKPVGMPDPKDVEAFGADLVEMVRRQATQELGELGAHVSELLNRMAAIEQKVAGLGKSTAAASEQSFASVMTTLVPDWEAINVSEPFLNWLGQVDPVYGLPRQVALDAAAKELNPQRCAAIFNAFKSTQTQTPVNPGPSLNEQQAPGRGAGGNPPVDTQVADSFSASEISAFYDDLRRGKYHGREDAALTMEARINAAVAAGRVTK